MMPGLSLSALDEINRKRDLIFEQRGGNDDVGESAAKRRRRNEMPRSLPAQEKIARDLRSILGGKLHLPTDAAPLARITRVPAARDGAAAVFQAAIVDNDAASQESLAQVADGLTERLRGRLTDAGLPAFLAPRLPLPRGWRKD